MHLPKPPPEFKPARKRLEQPVVIAVFPKNRDGEFLRVELTKSRGGGDIVAVETRRPQDWRTEVVDGFACHVFHLPKLAKAFADAERRARDLGLIDAEDDGEVVP